MPHRLTLIDPRLPALLLALASAGVLGAAFVFQYGFGYQPCILCIWQRWPYAAVLAFSITTLAFPRWRGVGDALLVASGFALLANVGIASYHVGVEQHWWAGLDACTGGAAEARSVESLKAMLAGPPPARCDQIPWELFGLSMAGYNALYALGLAVFAGWCALRRKEEA